MAGDLDEETARAVKRAGRPGMIAVVVIGVLIAGAFVVVALTSEPAADTVAATSSSTAAAPTTTTAVTTAPGETTPHIPTAEESATLLASCTPAAEVELALIRPALTGGAVDFAHAYSEAAGSVHYISAEAIDATGERVERDPVWAIDGGIPFAVSTKAKRISILPDSDAIDVSIGDDPAVRAQACTAASLQTTP